MQAAVGCLLLLVTALSPRLGLVAIWFFSDWLDRAFDGILLPILGFIFLPWTTALYTLGYVLGGGFSPWGIIGIVVGLISDLSLHSGTVRSRRTRVVRA